MTRLADVVIVGEVVAVRPSRAVERPKPFGPIEFQLVDFALTRILKGSPPGLLTLERYSDTLNGQPVISAADGGPFHVGATYLLFLKHKQDVSYYRLINDQSRYAITTDARLSTAAEGPVAVELRGKTLAEVMQLIRATPTARER
jgi:hypothetical protein